MNSENFDAVQALLKLKRYEQPPPRYFNEFSSIVIARIEGGERGHASFWDRFGFDLRPVLAGVLGATACGLVLFGLAASDQPDWVNSNSSFANIAAPAFAKGTVPNQPGRSVAGWPENSGVSSITPVIAARNSTWPVQRLDIVPASFGSR